MVDIRISKVTTIISINNWFFYQGVDNKTDNRTDTNKNDKKYNNSNWGGVKNKDGFKLTFERVPSG